MPRSVLAKSLGFLCAVWLVGWCGGAAGQGKDELEKHVKALKDKDAERHRSAAPAA